MRLFNTNGAQHYCSNFSLVSGDAEDSIGDFFYRNNFSRSRPHRPVILSEGSNIFDSYRACSLRDVERNLFLAASQYRRFLDLLVGSSANWSFVTIYYGNWYAANALLGMFGCKIFKKHFCEVTANNPGNQRLSIIKTESTHTSFTGSHEQFWDLFYKSVTSILSLVPPHLSFALLPVSSKPEWQIKERNKLNYDTYFALDLTRRFQSSFNHLNFPSSLPGSLNTQYRIFEAMLEITFSFAKQFNLNTDGITSITADSRRVAINNLIYKAKAPSLVSKTKKNSLIKR